MRSLVWWLALMAAVLAGLVIFLPLLSFLVAVVGGLLALAAVVVLTAPLLQRLPWFRNRLRVEQHGGFRTIRFGDSFTVWHGDDAESADRGPESRRRLADSDVIDVEGREIPD